MGPQSVADMHLVDAVAPRPCTLQGVLEVGQCSVALAESFGVTAGIFDIRRATPLRPAAVVGSEYVADVLAAAWVPSLRLAWIAAVGDRPVADGGDSDRPVVVRELVDDSVRADSQRVQAAKPATQRIAGVWLALKQRQGFLGGVDQRPVEHEQLGARAPSEYQSSHQLLRRS